jgi:AraC-like DNA-binding protein
MPVAKKKAHLIELYKDISKLSKFDEGIFPPYVFVFFWLAWAVLFITLNYRLINRFKKHAPAQTLTDNEDLISWLQIMNGLLVGIAVSALIVAVFAPLKKVNVSVVDLSLGITIGGICLQLFMRPKLLYGIFQPVNSLESAIGTIGEPKITAENIIYTRAEDTQTEKLLFIRFDNYNCKIKIETLFINQLPFLKADYSLDQLMLDTNIPRHILSAFINREYRLGFREFLNSHRIDYFKKNLVDNIRWKDLTLEAIASECGFASRSTFINNFKSITGQTPSEYLKENSLQSYFSQVV